MDRLNNTHSTSRRSRRAQRAATALLTCSLAATLAAGLTPDAHAGALAAKGDYTLAHASRARARPRSSSLSTAP